MMESNWEFKLSKQAKQELIKIPSYLVYKLQLWIDGVKNFGLEEIRKILGYHDEALKGRRQGQRSIRLNKAYRAIYTINEENEIYLVTILEVNKHDY